MTDTYKRAYTEVLEIIKYLPAIEYAKIPNDKIKFYKENMDKEYDFHINPAIDLDKQNISREANAILVTLFNDYFATDEQKKVLKSLLNQNQQKLEQKKLEIYNQNEIFNKTIMNTQDDKSIQEKNVENSLVETKENFFTKFINFIKNIFKR